MNLKNRMIIEEFRKERDDFLKLETIVSDKLHKIISDAGLLIMAIEHRVKTEESLAGKLERADKYQKLSELTDILGTRVICFFNDEVDLIGKMVEERFEVDWENSSDKRKLIASDTFGYLSLHYICTLRKDEGFGEELTDKRFEIQIRTNLQHTWAQINHDLGYKSEFGVPREITRSFSRIAGLLELVDDEFVRARDKMKAYTESVKEKIANNQADDVRIDTISLFEYIKHNKVMQEFLKELADISKAEISLVNPDGYIEQLAFLNVKTLGELQELMVRDRELAKNLAMATLESAELDILSSSVGLRFLCRAELLNADYTEDQITEFLNMTIGNEERARRQAKFLLRQKD